MAKVKSETENLKQLRKIVKKIESTGFSTKTGEPIWGYDPSQYRNLTEKIDSMVHEELKKLDSEKTDSGRLQTYESLFTSIVSLLEGVKQTV